MKTITREDALRMLKLALERDAETVENLVHLRVTCGSRYARTPGLATVKHRDFYGHAVGLLEILNTLFGTEEGCLRPVLDAKGHCRGFEVGPCEADLVVPRCTCPHVRSTSCDCGYHP